VALLSHGLWERRFGARPDVLGQAIVLDGRPHTIVGVMPRRANLFPMTQVAIWTPRPQEVSFLVRRQIEGGGFFFTVLARLKPGDSLETARAQVRDIALAYAAAHPTNADTKATADVNPMLDNLVGNQRQTYVILFGAVACLLLIASANVANLALARYAARRRQIAIRCAIGAGRRHVIAEMLSENLVLALAGGALGVLLAAGQPPARQGMGRRPDPARAEITLDPLVLLFSLCVSVLTGLALSLFPAWQLSKPDVIDALKDGGREVAAGRHPAACARPCSWPRWPVSFVLLVAAGLLVASFARLQAVDPKFSAERILVGNIQAPQTRYPDGSEPLVSSTAACSSGCARFPA
jgi:putative ABC transport system permease protein